MTAKYSPGWDPTAPGAQADFLFPEAYWHQSCVLPETSVIWGRLGGWKTTLAQQVILAWAQDAFYSLLQGLAHFLPLLPGSDTGADAELLGADRAPAAPSPASQPRSCPIRAAPAAAPWPEAALAAPLPQTWRL